MSFGGLLGNVIFFAASGFCLYDVKDKFFRWYGKRFLRIYPIVAAFTVFTVIIGAYRLDNFADFVKLFVFPTNYVFIVWIILLYVPFYFVSKWDKDNPKTLQYTAVAVCVLWLLTYLIFVDKSTYCVDTVASPFILFLYFISMIMGAWFNKNRDKFERIKFSHFIYAFLSLGAYFITKILFSRFSLLYPLQIINQFAILLALAFVFTAAMELEETLKKLNDKIFYPVKLISNMTLHIYIVQFIIIRWFSGLIFPINFFVVTALILVCAAALYYLEYLTKKGVSALCRKFGQGLKNDA